MALPKTSKRAIAHRTRLAQNREDCRAAERSKMSLRSHSHQSARAGAANGRNSAKNRFGRSRPDLFPPRARRRHSRVVELASRRPARRRSFLPGQSHRPRRTPTRFGQLGRDPGLGAIERSYYPEKSWNYWHFPTRNQRSRRSLLLILARSAEISTLNICFRIDLTNPRVSEKTPPKRSFLVT